MEIHFHESIQIYYKAFIRKPTLTASITKKTAAKLFLLVAYLSRLLQLLTVIDCTCLIANLHLGAVV